MADQGDEGNRRIDRILDPGFTRGLTDIPVGELRARRDECLAEREYLSILRRLVQGRLDILLADRRHREEGREGRELIDEVSEALGHELAGGSRGQPGGHRSAPKPTSARARIDATARR